ncbi:MAG: metalloregulator ArsR/SmtB family transcription factor [bacterium]
MKKLEKTMKALANRRRLWILSILKNKATASVSELAKEMRVSIMATSRHVVILRAAGIVHRERSGKFVIYHIAHDLDPAAEAIVKLL